MAQLDRLYEEIRSISNKYMSLFDKRVCSKAAVFSHGFRQKSKIIIQTRTFGCSWYNSGSGCFMCSAYNQLFKKQKITSTQIIKQFDILENTYNLKDCNTLFAYSSNFLDNVETPLKARKHLYRLLNRYKNLKNIVFQTRPELISPENLNEIKKYLPDKDVTLRLGIETSNDFIRKYCVNKSFSFNFVKKKVKLMHDFNLQASAFLLIKPPFLTEKEAIDDALTSIRDCFEIGIKDVVMKPVIVFKPSLVGLLYRLKMYRPTWVWSIVHILKESRKTEQYKQIVFSTLTSGDTSSLGPKNCPQCTQRLYKLIRLYNIFKKDITFFDRVRCGCKSKWEDSINQTDASLKKRIITEYKQLITRYKKTY